MYIVLGSESSMCRENAQRLKLVDWSNVDEYTLTVPRGCHQLGRSVYCGML
jgi:hypothetical protein